MSTGIEYVIVAGLHLRVYRFSLYRHLEGFPTVFEKWGVKGMIEVSS